MDLLSIVQALWRNKRFVIPVIVLTAIAALYADKMQPPVYQAAASVLLENPQGQATKAQIAANPSLKTADPNNPFLSYGNLDVAANVVLDLINNPGAQSALAKVGVDPRYTLTLSTNNGNPPIIDISGVGGTAQAAINSATILTNTIKADLRQIQQQQGINPFYMITAADLIKPNQAYHASSGKIKSLVAVGVIGILLLFIVVSVSDAAAERRRKSRLTGSAEHARTYRADQGDRATAADDMELTVGPVRQRHGNPDAVHGAGSYPATPRYQPFQGND